MHTRTSLVHDLETLVPRGGVLLVHSSCRSLGKVEGGADTVVAALREALGPEGTLMVPTFTTNLTDPYVWPVPPPPELRERLIGTMPVFDRDTTPSFKMGAIPEAVRRAEGAIRSEHPVTSWTAVGPRAAALLADHPLDDPEGEAGPLGRAMDLDARILLLGVGHDTNTTIHLAESMLDLPHLRELPDRYPVETASGRIWRPITKTTHCSDAFLRLEPLLEADGAIVRGRVGDAEVQVLRSRDVVRVATALLRREPTALLCDDVECPHCPTSRRVLSAWTPPI